MVVLGEFSLIIAGTASGELKVLLLSVGSFGVVFTAIASSFLISRQEQMYALLRQNVPARSVATGRAFAAYFSSIVKDFSPQGGFWQVSKVCWGCVSAKAANLVAILVCIWLARASVSLFGIAAGVQATQLRGAIAIVGGVLVLYYVIQILRDLRPVLDALSHAIARHKKNAKDESIMLRDIGFATFFLAAAVVLPEVEAALMLPWMFNFADELAFVIALAFIWDLITHARRIVGKRIAERRGVRQ